MNRHDSYRALTFTETVTARRLVLPSFHGLPSWFKQARFTETLRGFTAGQRALIARTPERGGNATIEVHDQRDRLGPCNERGCNRHAHARRTEGQFSAWLCIEHAADCKLRLDR